VNAISFRHPARQPHRWLALILGAYLLLALGYGIVNPLFEAPDEHWHYFTAQYIAETGELPRVTTQPDPWMAQEAAQPPLYYLLGSLLVRPIPTAGARETLWPNPFVQLGDASAPVNRNAFVHGPWENWPWQGYVLAAHLLRALSALFGLVTLLAIYASGRLLWPTHPERTLLATALVAFLPQFLFLHGAISNDPLIIMLVSLALWQLLVLWLGEVSNTRLLLLGLTIGLAILTKTAGLLLLIYASSVLVVRGWHRHRSLWAVLRPLIFVGGVALLVSGWLLWRNWTLYGDITAVNQFIHIAGGDRDYTLMAVLGESGGLWTSFFAVFGWFNVRAPGWVYWIWNGLILLALAGGLVSLFSGVRAARASRRADPDLPRSGFAPARSLAPLLIALWPALVYAGLVNFMLRTPAAQGRLLFPGLLPLGLAIGFGLDRLRWPPLLLLAPLLALFTALYSLFFVIPPVYELPPQVNAAAIPDQARAYKATLDGGLELAGVDLETREAQPGEVLWLTLYWETGHVPVVTPEIVLELFGYEGELVGKLQSLHGGGLYPPRLWPEEGIIVDRVGVRLDKEMDTPTEVNLHLGLADAPRRVPGGVAKAVPERWPAGADAVLARLGDEITLTAANVDREKVRPGDRLTVSVEWQVLAPPGRSLTTFLHLGEPDQAPLVTGDSVPRQGYYPTIWWEEGEVIRDTYTLALPTELAPGRYPLLIGMYEPVNDIRLSLTVAGERQPAGAYRLAWIVVE